MGHLLWEIILEILLLCPRQQKSQCYNQYKWNTPKLENLGLAFDKPFTYIMDKVHRLYKN